MTLAGESPGRRRRLLVLFVLLLSALGVALTAVPTADREGAKRLAGAYTPLHEPQETWLDWLQEPPYAVALLVCVVMAARLRRRPERLPYWIVLAAVTAWLLWRELPWDERVLGANTFSWAKYLGRSELPAWAKVVFGGGSILATVLLVAYVVRNGRTLGRLLRERLISPSTLFAVLAGLALVGAHIVDKHRLTDRLLGTNLSAWDLKDYLEESLEVFGPVLLAMACVLAAVEEPPVEAASQRAGVSA